MNENWYRLNTVSKRCGRNIMFGITDRSNVPDYLFEGRSPRKGSTVIWNPDMDVHVSIGSYVEAQRMKDPAMLAKLEAAGIPADIDFGYWPNCDMSSTYVKTKVPKAKKADSVKVMRAEYGGEFEDGAKFRPGEVVKIVFRKKFVEGRSGAKCFRNAYERPSEEELKAFLAEESGRKRDANAANI